MNKKEVAKRVLIRDLNDISYELGNEDCTPDDAMDAIMESLKDYEDETGDLNVRKATKKFYNADQIKEQVLEFLTSQDKPTEKTLQQAQQTLAFADFSKYWYLEEKKHYTTVRAKDVDGLIQAMLSILDAKKNDKKRKELVEYLSTLDFTDTVDIEEDYRDIINKCINYGADTQDYRPRDFCDKWIISTYELLSVLRKAVQGDFDGIFNLRKTKAILEKCDLSVSYYQKLKDGTFTDLSVDGLEWLREQLVTLLKETK